MWKKESSVLSRFFRKMLKKAVNSYKEYRFYSGKEKCWTRI